MSQATPTYEGVRNFLKQYGYLAEVPVSRLERLDQASTIVHEALTKLQLLYGQSLIGYPDGILGPKTAHAVTLERCGCPDYFDPELPQRVERAGSGSWPTACHETGIRVHIDVRNAPAWYNADDDFAYLQKQFSLVGLVLVRTTDIREAHIRQSFEALAGNTIGLAEFNNRSCSDAVFNKRHPGYDGGLLRNRNLNLHETAHNCNVEHTQGGIMAPVINDAKPVWVERDHAGNIIYKDIAYPVLASFFGGAPLPGPQPEPPAPIPIPVPPTPQPPVPRPPVNFPIPPEVFIGIIEKIIKLICPDATPAQARSVWKDPRDFRGLRARLIMSAEVRRYLNVSPREWRREVRAQVMPGIYEQIDQMSDDEFESHVELAVGA